MKALIALICAMFFAFGAGVYAAGPDTVDENVAKEVQQKGVSRVLVGVRVPATSIAAASASSYLAHTLTPGKASTAQITAINDTLAVADVDQDALDTLRKDPRIAFIIRDEVLPPTVEDDAALIGADHVWSAGFRGAGVAIAILDTGVDAAHPMLAGKVKEEACFSVTDLTAHSRSLCPSGADVGNGNWVDTSPGSGANCNVSIAGCEHGTQVAGIAAGRAEVDGTHKMSGIAPDADLISIQVFSRFDRPEDCTRGPAPCVGSYISSQLRALQYVHGRVLDHLATGRGSRIVAVNLSFGGGWHPAICDTDQPEYTREISELRDDGVGVFVAAGNDSYVDAVNFPACIGRAIAIGALDDPGTSPTDWSIAGFSDRSGDSLVSLLTFGVNLRSPVPGGAYRVDSGTSLAAPLAAGAYATLAAAFPMVSVDDIVKALRDTGLPVKEPVSKKNIPAIRLADAYTELVNHPKPAARTGAANSPPPGEASGSATRFIVDVPTGDAAAKLSVLQQSIPSLSTSLNAGQVGVSTITPNALSVTTEKPVDSAALRASLQDRIGPVGSVTPDVALPVSR